MRGEAEKTELAVTRARALRISAGAGPLSEGSLTVIAQPCAALRRQEPTAVLAIRRRGNRLLMNILKRLYFHC
jgi:hypothetical protein